MRRLFRQGKRLGLGATAIFLAGALLVGSVMPAKAAEERVITVGLHAAFTGALATTAAPMGYGILDSLRYMNERGGINGIEINCMWFETQGLVPQAITAHRRFKEAGAVLEFQLSSTPTEVLTPRLQKDEIPIISYPTPTTGTITRPLSWVFGYFPGVPSVVPTFVTWLKDIWTEERPPRIGHILYDHSSGWEALKGTRDYAPEQGIDFVGYEVIPLLGAIDTSTEILRLAAKKPDWVATTVTGASAVTLVKDIERLEIAKRGIKFVSTGAGPDESVLNIVGKAGEGWHIISPAPAITETELPGVKLMVEAAKRYRGFEPKDITEMYRGNWLLAQVGAEGIRVAVERVGYENLNGHAVRDGLANIRDFDTGCTPPISVSNEHPAMASFVRILQYRQGFFQPISDWIKVASPMRFE